MRFLAALAGLALAVALALVFWPSESPRTRPEQRPPHAASAGRSYAELVAANYRVLSEAQSRRLLRFADSFSSCMTKNGVALGHPVPRLTKIVMTLPSGSLAGRLGRLVVQCAEALGGPPKGASLVQPNGDAKHLELYLPKRCLLDRKVTAAHA